MTRSPFPALFALAAALILLPSAVRQDEDKKKDDYKEKTAKHKEDVTKLRGLEFKAPVAVGAYSKQELLDFLKAEFEKDLPRRRPNATSAGTPNSG